MRVVVRELGQVGEPDVVLRRLAARARARGLPPPAALTGHWFDGSAVIAPSVRIEPTTDPLALLDRGSGQVDAPAGSEVVDAPEGSVGGGWIGYLGFAIRPDATRIRDDVSGAGNRRHVSVSSGRRLPVAAWGWTDCVLRRDDDGLWWFEALVADGSPFPRALADDLTRALAGPEPQPAAWSAEVVDEPDRVRHELAIESCLAAIRAGEIYQANVCTRYGLRLDGDPAEVFAAGIRRYSPARAAYLAGPWGALVSLSPELFLARRGRRVRSSPIKGTDPADPARLAASVKDRAENVMIVDLVRNDLGRVCEPGSVGVPELLAVHRAPGVWHLVSTVDGRLRPDVTEADLLAATFPPGSVTGTPKLRALELLAELEPAPREAYCGAIGMVSPVAGLELNVAIRTVEVAPGGTAWIGVGGGITIDSVPAAEWAECRAKVAPLLDLLVGPGPAVASVRERAAHR